MTIAAYAKTRHVLVIDDDEADVFLTTLAFRRCEHSVVVHHASDGAKAIAYLRQCLEEPGMSLPSLILLDLNMPRKNGLETLLELKQDETLMCVPVIVMTTSDSRDDIYQTYRHHASCFITKPIDLETFSETLQALCRFWFQHVAFPFELD